MSIPDTPLGVWCDNLVDLCARFINQQPDYRTRVLGEAQGCFVDSHSTICESELMELAQAVIKKALADCRERVLAPAFDAELDATFRADQLLTQIEQYYVAPVDLSVVGCLIPALRQLEKTSSGELCQSHFTLWVEALQATLAPLLLKNVPSIKYRSLALLQGARLMHSAVWDRGMLIKQTCSQLRQWWLLDEPAMASVPLRCFKSR